MAHQAENFLANMDWADYDSVHTSNLDTDSTMSEYDSDQAEDVPNRIEALLDLIQSGDAHPYIREPFAGRNSFTRRMDAINRHFWVHTIFCLILTFGAFFLLFFGRPDTWGPHTFTIANIRDGLAAPSNGIFLWSSSPCRLNHTGLSRPGHHLPLAHCGYTTSDFAFLAKPADGDKPDAALYSFATVDHARTDVLREDLKEDAGPYIRDLSYAQLFERTGITEGLKRKYEKYLAELETGWLRIWGPTRAHMTGLEPWAQERMAALMQQRVEEARLWLKHGVGFYEPDLHKKEKARKAQFERGEKVEE